MNKTKVSISKSTSYEYESVFNSVKSCIDLLGGIKHFVKPGDKVLLKPNLLAAKTPDKAVTTHPAIVKSIVEIVKESGGIPLIGDSQAIGKWEKIIDATGMKQVAKETGATLTPFVESVKMENNASSTFKRLEIAKQILEADVIINLPKIKTHSQMFLTLGVKNLYGCIVGARKARLHMEAGREHSCFAGMLVELYENIKPSLTIIDGIIGMEGNGPGSGDSREIGVILGAIDCIAMDRVICEILGANESRLYTLVEGKKKNAGETDLNRIEVLGERIEDVKVTDFIFPTIGDVAFGPKFLRKYIRMLFASKPVEHKVKCTLCGHCIKACPPQIIKEKNQHLSIIYEKCIRCYCCVEVCPHGAMTIKQGYLARLFNSKLT